jgi:hypothetical protein
LWQSDLIHSAEDHAEWTNREMHFWHGTMFVLNTRPTELCAGVWSEGPSMETTSPGSTLTLMLTPEDEDFGRVRYHWTSP